MLYLFLAFITGSIIVIQMYMNSQISERVNSYNGIFYNYFIATLFLGFYYLVKPALFMSGFSKLGDAAPISYLGAFFGISIVATCNIAFRKFSATYATSAIIFGQLTMALIIDRISGVVIPSKAILGIVLIAIGIALNTYIDNRERDVPSN